MRARKFPFNNYNGIKNVTAAVTLSREDAGKQIKINTTTACVVTLPAVNAANRGVTFLIQLLQLPSSGGHEIAPVAADKIFASFASSTAAADDKSLFFGSDASGTGDKIGDFIELQSDGVDGYHQVGGQGSFFREA